MINLTEGINDEQLLDFALSHSRNIIADKIIVNYCIKELLLDKGNFTEEEVNERYCDLIMEHMKKDFVDRGMLEYDMEDGKYRLTDLGRKSISNEVMDMVIELEQKEKNGR